MSFIVTMGDEQTKSLQAPKRAYTPSRCSSRLTLASRPTSSTTSTSRSSHPSNVFVPLSQAQTPFASPSVLVSTLANTKSAPVTPRTSNHPRSSPSNPRSPTTSASKTPRASHSAAVACHEQTTFEGLCDSTDICTPDGIKCSNAQCGQLFSNGRSSRNSKHRSARRRTSTTKAGSSVTTRAATIARGRCPCMVTAVWVRRGGRRGVLGRMNYEYPEKLLYNQLLYFSRVMGCGEVENQRRKVRGRMRG